METGITLGFDQIVRGFVYNDLLKGEDVNRARQSLVLVRCRYVESQIFRLAERFV